MARPVLSEIQSLDDCRDEICRLYVEEEKTLSTVIDHIEKWYGKRFTPRQYKTKIARWGFQRNTKRGDVLKLLHEANQAVSAGSALMEKNGHLQKVERYCRKNFSKDPTKLKLLQGLQAIMRSAEAPRPHSPTDLQPADPPALKVPEDFLRGLDTFVTRSFVSGSWGPDKANALNHIIECSPSQLADLRSLHAFLNALEVACKAFDAGDNALAVSHSERAFDEVDQLVQSGYHDIVPNLIQQLNNLRYKGHPQVAHLLRDRIAICSAQHHRQDGIPQTVLMDLGKLDLEQLEELEERIMTLFLALFQRHLHPRHYNSFVMLMNGAWRRLSRSPWIGFDECIPALGPYDTAFGRTDRRPLDIIRLRTELYYQRGLYEHAEAEGALLAHRAAAVRGDDWLRLYFEIKGWYYVVRAQSRLPGRQDLAATSLMLVLKKMNDFLKVDTSGIFRPERLYVTEQPSSLRVPPSAVTDVTAHLSAG